ncbi:hypothetical protein F8R89_10615 [Streptomyces sp. SS1-1]|uniref:hypothetical protein n=1 Tax=Streptomyces sp. SS1-1 TaxID=2651869 RepID=UPI001250050F|nr:hypothetical protein [Streptomyces sp. SS1-1]KAB2972460.1 hypothetical protein F8R89_10615 [Streptomyces sp. SS1-1]
MIQPDSIPLFTGDLGQLERHTDALRVEADGIRRAGAEAHRQFQGLSAFYEAPEAEQLLASTAPARDGADTFADKVATVADALSTYAAEVAPVIARLERLQSKATAFVAGLKTPDGEFDEDWTDDADKVEQHQALMHDVNVAQAAFTAAEIACNNKITALVGGTQYVMSTGDKQFMPLGSDLYGYSAEVLDQAEKLPWGTPETQSHDWWDPDDLGYYAKSFFWDGFIVDNVWGTVDGLATLAGVHGSDDAGQAWEGVVRAIVGAETYLMESGGQKPTGAFASDFAQDSKQYAKEFGKSFVAWDMWKENPARAAATVVFNGLTLGAGPLKAASAGRAGTAAKVATSVAKVGDAIDPVSATVKVTGHAIPKIAQVTDSLRGANNVSEVRTPHSVLEFSDHSGRSVLVVEDGRFIVLKDGKIASGTPVQEPSVTARAPSEELAGRERELAGVGGRSQSPQASTHTGGGSAGTTADTGGSVQGHTSHASSPRQGTGDANGTGSGHEPSRSAARSSGSNPHSGGTNSAGDRDLTVEERKRIRDEHVWKSNNDPAWREEHYDALDRRKEAARIVDGVELPILARDGTGKLVAKNDLPSGPSDVKYGRTPLGPDSADPMHRPELDRLAKDRKVAGKLTDATKAVEEAPTHEAHEALKRAQEAYAEQLGDVPNNSKISEKLGEKAAELHVVPHEFPGAEWVPLPKTPNGADMFDQVYKLGDDGGFVIVEAKAPSADLGWRRGAGPYEGMMVKQGTKEYFYTILEKMWARGGKDTEIANALEDALEEGKLQYVLVKANENTGSYAGSVMEYFKIR